MSKTVVYQIIGQDTKTKQAISEYITLGELDRTINNKADRDAWEQLWQEFLHSDKWVFAISFIQKYGI